MARRVFLPIPVMRPMRTLSTLEFQEGNAPIVAIARTLSLRIRRMLPAKQAYALDLAA